MRPLLVLYKYPVSWADFDMSDHFDDFIVKEYKRFSDCMYFAWQFSDKFNTYVGFFYTIAGDWIKENFAEKHMPKRHPWIAIYRPINPHHKPYTGGCELLIWDPLAKTLFPGEPPPHMDKMIDMQRRLVKVVKEIGGEKNPGLSLQRLWLGGFDITKEQQSSSNIDTTMKYLEALLANVRLELPPFDGMLIKNGNYKQVVGYHQADPGGNGRDKSTSDTASGFSDLNESPTKDGAYGDDDGNLPPDEPTARIIFHPPRATAQPSGPQQRQASKPHESKCRNLLYEAARLERLCVDLSQAPPTHMKYSFSPTGAWYEAQCREGRGFENLVVEPWERMFKRLEIGMSSAVAPPMATSSGLAGLGTPANRSANPDPRGNEPLRPDRPQNEIMAG